GAWRHELRPVDGDHQQQHQRQSDRLAPFRRPPDLHRLVDDDRLFLLLLALPLLLFLFAFRERRLLALDLVHLEVVLGHRDVVGFGLRRRLLAFLGHRRRGRGFRLAPDLFGFALAALFLLRALLLFLGRPARFFLLAPLLPPHAASAWRHARLRAAPLPAARAPHALPRAASSWPRAVLPLRARALLPLPRVASSSPRALPRPFGPLRRAACAAPRLP